VPEGDEQADPVDVQPASDEGQGVQGLGVQPVGVVDDAQQRSLRGDVRRQGQRAQSDQEAVWYRAAGEPESHAQGGALGCRQPAEPVEMGKQQSVGAGVTHLLLGLRRR
jgi:hypothetical protein